MSKSSPNCLKGQGNPCQITVNKGDLIPCDGRVISGFAFVDESAVAGVSTPAMLDESEGRNTVLANTVVVEGSLTIQCNKR